MSIFSTLFSSSRLFSYEGTTDWHCHVLPGVDDGVQNIDDSLKILHEYEQMGVKCVWLTPHIMEDVPNTVASLNERFALLKERYDGNIVLNLAAENMIDSLFVERLKSNDVLPIGDRQDTLLVETSYFNPPLNDLKGSLELIKSSGFYPLLAHPERYDYILSMSEYRQLKDAGVLFQLNLLSLTGFYGKNAKEKSQQLLKAGFYDAYGSDIHRLAQLQYLQQLSLPKQLIRNLQKISF
jgi:tyrosine-protein phosphatase YwqE